MALSLARAAARAVACRPLGACLLGLWLAGCALPPATEPEADAGAPAAAAPGSAPAPRRGKPAVRPAPAPAIKGGADQDQADAEPGQLLGRGLASWYGPELHGRRTASGERFDKGGLTAAHRTLPFGARVCVRSMVNGKVVMVRVNDRGPFVRDREIDLSQAAAQELGMVGLGIKPVEIWRMAGEDDDCRSDSLPALDEAATAKAARAPAPVARKAVQRKRPARRR